MEKIGLMGDTHGNRRLMEEAVRILTRREGVARIWHLGDSYKDGETLASKVEVPVLFIPGIYCEEYKNGAVPKKAAVLVDEIQFVLVHDLEDLIDEDRTGANVILFGHSHKYQVMASAGKIYINPGHLKDDEDKGREPTFALLAVDGYKLECSIMNTAGVSLAKASYLLETGFFK